MFKQTWGGGGEHLEGAKRNTKKRNEIIKGGKDVGASMTIQ